MAYKKYFDRIGQYGLYAVSTEHAALPFHSLPKPAEYTRLKSHSHIKFIQVRYSWKALQPLNPGNSAGLPTQAAYKFDTFIGPLLDACHGAGIRCKIELYWTMGAIGDPNTPSARILEIVNQRHPVPKYMLDDGFSIDPDDATGTHGGGCYLIYGISSHSPGKLWPRLWVPEVGNEFALMCEMLLKYIQAHRYADAFDGLVLTETLMQQANVACRGNSNGALNFSSEKLRVAYLNITNRIANTWNEPLHAILVNHGMLSSDTANGGKSGMTKSDWTAWFNECFTKQGFAISIPDTWEIDPQNTSPPKGQLGKCEPSQRIDTNPVSGFALENYRNKTIVIPGFQKPSTYCRNPGDIIKWGANLASNLRPANGLRDGFNAGGWVCAALLKREAPNAEATSWPNNWGSEEYLAATKNIQLHTAFPVGALWERAGTSAQIPAPGNLDVSLVGGVSTVSWTYTANTDLTGFKIWVSDTQGEAIKSGTTELTKGRTARSVPLADLTPPATAYWVNARATARNASENSVVVSRQMSVAPAFATPTNVCANFTDSQITWNYTDGSTPTIGFEVYINDVLVKLTGPTRRSMPKPKAEWVSGTTYEIKVVARGALASRSVKTHTFTSSGQTSGTSCTA